MRQVFLFLIASMLHLACSDNRHAGSASVTTNGTITGQVTDTSGTGLPNATTILVSSDFDPKSISQGIYRSTVTDGEGNYVFEDVPEGDYHLVVSSSDSASAATVQDIKVSDGGDVVVPAVPLVQYGSIRIRYVDFAFAVGDRIYLPGSLIEITVTAQMLADSAIVMTKVPAGTYAQVVYEEKNSQQAVSMVSVPVIVKAGGQTVLQPDHEGVTGIPVGFFLVDRADSLKLGGEGGDTVIASDTAALRTALLGDETRVVKVLGKLQGTGQILSVGSNKTIIGIGDSATLDSIGLELVNKTNVVIRNLIFTRSSDDAISVETSSNIWIDHNSFSRCADGMIDVKRASEWITVSWNRFSNQALLSTIGHSDENGKQDSLTLHVTFHHNLMEDVGSGAPRVRYGTVHIYNNVYDSISGYAIASTQFAKIVVESNMFIKVKEPTRTQHTSPNPGELVETGNVLSESGKLVTAGGAFKVSSYYTYTAQTAEEAEIAVRAGAGAGHIPVR